MPSIHRNWKSALLVGLVLWVAIGILWQVFQWGPEEYHSFMANLIFQPVLLVAGLFAWQGSEGTKLDSGVNRAWRIMGCAFLVYGIGDAIWFYYEVYLGIDPFPSLADIPYLLFYPVMLWGLLTLPTPSVRQGEKLQFWIDTGIVLLGGSMLSWHFVLGPTTRSLEDGLLSNLLSLAYPVGDMVLLLGVITILLRRWENESRKPLSLLALGVILFIVGDLSFAYVSLSDGYQSGGWQDRLWLVAEFVIALSAYAKSRGVDQPKSAVDATALARPFRFLPYLAVALSYGLLLRVAWQQEAHQLEELLYGAVTMTVLVLARQVILGRENILLSAENAARQSEARFRSLVQNSSDVIAIVNNEAMVIYLSPSVVSVFGYSPEDLIGNGMEAFVHPDDAALATATLAAVSDNPVTAQVAEWRLIHRDGRTRRVELTINNLLTDPNVMGVVLNIRDSTERLTLEQRIRYQAYHDNLTNLANRALFKEALEQALMVRSAPRQSLAVLVLDLDRFKTINDSLGHSVGDGLLKAVSTRLLRLVKATDTVARLGGDEFAILMPGVDVAEASTAAQALLDGLGISFQIEDREVVIGASLGIALSTQESINAEGLLRDAEVAMYRAKDQARGQIQLFHHSMYAKIRERLDLEVELRRAVECSEFVVYYQPTISLATGQVVGFEALVRWLHPVRGLISPLTFIPLAEEIGLILPIGRWVLQEACQQVRLWQQRHPSKPAFTMSVNLSVRQLEQLGLVEEVALALREAGLHPGCLTLEITESVLMQRAELIMDNLQQLRSLGIRLAIDDFGTGYSSLSYLRGLPVDILKLDKSFIQQINRSHKDLALIRGILNLAQALALETVAEGIELAEQFDSLAGLRCHLGQGYLFSRPVPPEEIEQILAEAPRYSPVRI